MTLQYSQADSSPDIHEYLPEVTRMWCEQCLRASGFDYPVEGGAVSDERTGERVHKEAYLHLRASVKRHMESGRSPELTETVRSSVAGNWQPRPETRGAFARAGQELAV